MTTDRRLYVLRHAKSSWDDPAQRDHDRPLAPRGKRAVKLLAEYVERNGIRPELILCSTARRTRDTLSGIGLGGETLVEAQLYTATVGELVERLRRVAGDPESVMVIGHNPAMQMLVLKLASSEVAPFDRLAEVRRKFPTGALATLRLGVPWEELGSGCAELSDYVRPKALQYN